jgi:hypothetical protein
LVERQYANATLIIDNPIALDLAIVNASLTVYVCANESATGECVNDAYTDGIGFFYEGDLSLKPIIAYASAFTTSKPIPIKLIGAYMRGRRVGAVPRAARDHHHRPPPSVPVPVRQATSSTTWW